MKITITDGNSTLVIENPESADSARNRKLMDVLFSQEPTNPESRADEVPTGTRDFENWLRSGTPITRVAQVSAHFNYEMLNMRSVHNLVMYRPEVVANLGEGRFNVLCRWLHFNTWLDNLPMTRSMRTYYNTAMRNTSN